MGIWENLIASLGLQKKQKMNLLFTGLDNAGKSSIIKVLQFDKVVNMVPTIGVSLEEFTRGKTNFAVFDMSGHGQVRDLWKHYFNDVHGIVVVIDTSDKDRISILKDELDEMLKSPILIRRKTPICFYANKMDLQGLSPTQCSQALGLELIKDRNWSIL